MIKALLLISLLCVGPLQADKLKEAAFTAIYKSGFWGTNEKGEGHSGSGSTLEATEEYRPFLQQFLQEHGIQSVVDFGCGDWEFSQTLDWSGINYLGIDVVKDVIERNKKNYGAPHIAFQHSDGTEIDLPHADLLICKDVLQHLSNKDAKRVIAQFHKYKYCLITNDFLPKRKLNKDIINGHYRYIDITKPPFNVEATPVLTFKADRRTKLVYLVTRG